MCGTPFQPNRPSTSAGLSKSPSLASTDLAVRTLAKLVLFSLPAILLTFAVLEFVALPLFVAIDDVPVEEYDAAHQILHYRPGQRGRSFPDHDLRNPVPFTVNADGWNSSHQAYELARSVKLRVAVVGDSYVAAFEVAPELSLAGQLETLLGEGTAEVYSFGIRGAPLSEYLQIARYVVATYKPDALVVVIVHNDFDESYRTVPGRYTSSFLRLKVDAERVGEIPPRPYAEPSLEKWLRTRSYLFRFFFYRLALGSQQLRSLYGSVMNAPPRYEANIDTGSLLGEEERMGRVATYVFDQFVSLERTYGTRFLLVMDTPRNAIYEGRDPRKAEAYRLNRIAELASRAAGLRFIDLTETFERDYRRHAARFEFPYDGHWNARAHELAAREVCGSLDRQLGGKDIHCGATVSDLMERPVLSH